MTKKMSSLKPQIDALQKKYKNNPEKLSQEQIKLYKKSGYNPLGCLVTFIPQLIILSVLIQVIRNVTTGDLNGIYPFVTNLLNGGASLAINTKFLMWDLTKSFNNFSSEFGIFSTEALPYLVLSVLVGVSQYLASKFTQVMQGGLPKQEESKKKGQELSPEEMTKKMTKSFSLILPFTTVFIAISVPAALSLYWTVQSFMLVIQYMLLDWDKTEKRIQNLFTKLRGNKEDGKKSPK